MVVLPTEKRFDWKYPPVMLFTIIMLNLLVFFLYQSGDGRKYQQALYLYQQADLLSNEWPAYRSYLQTQEQTELLQTFDEQSAASQYTDIIASIVGDRDFYRHLNQHSELLKFDPYELSDNWENWQHNRQRVNERFNSISVFQAGLIPSQLNPLTLLSHQFLHGDLGHLLGNMLFLIVCGFAVEAAIGPLLFLGLYLASGLLGGLFFALVDLQSETPLVGASGAISGVMAMYLAVFRLRQIEFFYWIFVFAGYFRAPALLLLPVYIGKELLDFWLNPNSNVAFLAHAGGFIGGALLVGLAYWLWPDKINNDYIEEDQSQDPQRSARARIYTLIDQYRFEAALQAIDQHLREYGQDFELALLRFHLARPQSDTQQLQSLQQLIQYRPVGEPQLQRLASAWQDSARLQSQVEAGLSLRLAMHLTTPEHLAQAEAIFEHCRQQQPGHARLGTLARKLSVLYQRENNADKQRYYEAIADQCVAGGG